MKITTSQLAAKAGVSEGQIRQLVVEKKLKRSGRNQFEETAAAWGLVTYWRERYAAGNDDEMRDLRKRKLQAETDLAEMNRDREAADVRFLEDYIMDWRARLVARVCGLKLSDADTDRILALCSDIEAEKLEELKHENEHTEKRNK